MIRAVALHCLCEPLAQFRTKAAEFDSLAGVFEWYWTNFHRFVCSFVPVLLKTINSWTLSRSVSATYVEAPLELKPLASSHHPFRNWRSRGFAHSRSMAREFFGR